jgi:hypothetical protein
MITLLGKLEAGFLPLKVFYEMARLNTLSTVELVPLLDEPGKPQVVLFQRAEDDKFWSNLWHIPGEVIRPTDDSYSDGLQRIIKGELENNVFVISPNFLRTNLRKENRGSMNAMQYWALLKKAPIGGQPFPIDQLPKEIVPEHTEPIALAWNAYLQLKLT